MLAKDTWLHSLIPVRTQQYRILVTPSTEQLSDFLLKRQSNIPQKRSLPLPNPSAARTHDSTSQTPPPGLPPSSFHERRPTTPSTNGSSRGSCCSQRRMVYVGSGAVSSWVLSASRTPFWTDVLTACVLVAAGWPECVGLAVVSLLGAGIASFGWTLPVVMLVLCSCFPGESMAGVYI